MRRSGRRTKNPPDLSVGSVKGNVFSRKEMEDTYSVGWNFNKNYEGKGYAAEAAKAYLDFLFTKKNVRRIYAYVADYNTRSQKLW